MPTLRYYRVSNADPTATTRQGNSTVNNNVRPAPQHPAPARFAEQQRLRPPEAQPAQGPKSEISSKQRMRGRERASAAAAPAPAPSAVPLPKSGSSPAEVTTTTTATVGAAAAAAAAAASVRRPGQILPTRRTVQADRPNAPPAATFPTGTTTNEATGTTGTPAPAAANTSTNASARQRKPKRGNRHRGRKVEPSTFVAEKDSRSRMPPPHVAQAAPMAAGGAKAAEAAAAYGTAASSVASIWTGSASSAIANNNNNPRCADTLLESTLSATPAAQLLGMITPEQASALASMELERRLLLRRQALVGEMTAAGGMHVGPGPRPRPGPGPGGIGSGGIGMGVGGMGFVGGLGRVGSMGVGRPSGTTSVSGHLGGGGPFVTSLAAAAAAGASANGGLGMLNKPPPPPPPPSLMMSQNMPINMTKPHFGRQPLDRISISAASSKAPADRKSISTPPKGLAISEHKSGISAASSKVTADQTPPATRVPTPPNWVANFELTADVATHAQALSSDLPLDPAVNISTSVHPIIGARAAANHPFASVGATPSNPVAFRQAQMRGLARNNNTAPCNLYPHGGFGLPPHGYQGIGGGGTGGTCNGDSRNICSSVVNDPAVRSASIPKQQQNMSPVDPKAKEATTSPPVQSTNGAVSTSSSSDDEDGDDSTMGETSEESSPAKKSRSRLKKRPISRPKNGYNFYFRHGSGKMKRRDEIIHIIRKRLKAYKEDTGKGAEHLFSSSFHYPSRINRTTMFAEQWGSDWIVRSGLRYRFQMEAASEQENYRSVIRAWQAAEKFQTRGSK